MFTQKYIIKWLKYSISIFYNQLILRPMLSQNKNEHLRQIIESQLTSFIDADYRYLMMCDHQNIGDTLIMEGEFQFLRTIKHYKCKEYTTMESFERRSPQIPATDLLIMRGSGSFGDIWHEAPLFWKFVMEKYPNNPILFMPQTIYFSKQDNLLDMARRINNHKKVILCVRDADSYSIAKQYFNCKILLVPDMAFYLRLKTSYIKTKYDKKDKILIVKRTDIESKSSVLLDKIQNDQKATVSDWPTIGHHGNIERVKNYLSKKQMYKLYDMFIRYVHRPYIINKGIKFLASYEDIYATRMHAGILGVLMGKRVHFIDNSYGKLSRVYHTWLTDYNNVILDE